jgi:4,5-dihydroxyphthalate decarboxylase
MLSLTCALSEYDHIRDLVSGRIRPEGISLSIMTMPVEEIFFRSLRFQEFDVSEMSMGRYSALIARGSCPLVAIPVFLSRMFRHSSIYVRNDRDILTPADLRGKVIGVPEWAQTAGIYVRGMLVHEHGVRLQEIEWIQAGIHQVGREEEVPIQLPEGVRLRRLSDRTLNDLLLSGEIDAIISAHPPNCIWQEPTQVKRLFENLAETERQYWRKTGIFPIMHTLVLRRELYDRHRWIGMNLLKAFSEAKERSLKRVSEMTVSLYPLPWISESADQIKTQFGDDYWTYGVGSNAATLSAFLQYAFEQGVTSRHLKVEELFPPEVRAQFTI